MRAPKRIGLIGLTGVGKSTVAEHLHGVHGFQIASTGGVCRSVSRLLFGNEDKANLIKLTDALQALDSSIFLKAALRDIRMERGFVIDALRYAHDYEYALEHDIFLIRVTASVAERRKRLKHRGQAFDFETDGRHASEIELVSVPVNVSIDNDGTKDQLFTILDSLLG